MGTIAGKNVPHGPNAGRGGRKTLEIRSADGGQTGQGLAGKTGSAGCWWGQLSLLAGVGCPVLMQGVMGNGALRRASFGNEQRGWIVPAAYKIMQSVRSGANFPSISGCGEASGHGVPILTVRYCRGKLMS